MSRTYRRKNATHLDWDKNRAISAWDERVYGTQDHDLIRRKRAAKFKSDHHNGYYGIPHWYTRMLNNKVTRANKAALNKCIKKDETDSAMMVPCKKNANYWW